MIARGGQSGEHAGSSQEHGSQEYGGGSQEYVGGSQEYEYASGSQEYMVAGSQDYMAGPHEFMGDGGDHMASWESSGYEEFVPEGADGVGHVGGSGTYTNPTTSLGGWNKTWGDASPREEDWTGIVLEPVNEFDDYAKKIYQTHVAVHPEVQISSTGQQFQFLGKCQNMDKWRGWREGGGGSAGSSGPSSPASSYSSSGNNASSHKHAAASNAPSSDGGGRYNQGGCFIPSSASMEGLQRSQGSVEQ